MMKLNQTIAQTIVKRTMKIIDYSVNVMNEQGIIIASGDPSRLNQKHIGAIIALRENRMVEIDEKLTNQWNNEVKPGINLPINYLDQLIGVIGISGEPKKVRHYTQLVTMTAELIVEQAAILERQQWHKRYKEEFIAQLLQGHQNNQFLLQESSFFSFDPNKKRRVVIIKVVDSNLDRLQILINKLEQEQLDYTVIGLDQVALLQQVSSCHEEYNKILSKLLPDSNKRSLYKIAVGSIVENIEQLSLSYKTAQNVLNYGLKCLPKHSFYFFDQHSLPALLFNLSDDWIIQKITGYIKQIEAKDNKKVLIKTLRQYFLSNCELDRTAQQLSIHPNTLRYRLERIEKITSLKFNKIEDKFSLYLALILN